MGEQYYEPYPVCHWAQALIEGARSVMQRHGFCAENILKIEVDTFHEAVRLTTNSPRTTEETQYATSFTVEVALAQGNISAYDVSEEALKELEILRLSNSLIIWKNKDANNVFPIQQLAKVTITLDNDQVYIGDWVEPNWEATDPPSALELKDKYHNLANSVLGEKRSKSVADAIDGLTDTKASVLFDLLVGGVN